MGMDAPQSRIQPAAWKPHCHCNYFAAVLQQACSVTATVLQRQCNSFAAAVQQACSKTAPRMQEI